MTPVVYIFNPATPCAPFITVTTMQGLYIHIPFCQSRCLYCDFFSTTQHDLRDRYVSALCSELEFRADECGSRSTLEVRGKSAVSTVYLGGGTPSQLTPSQLDRVFTAIHQNYEVEAGAEVTMECNPDDITPAYLHHLLRLGVNRLSLGIQTFDDRLLRFLHRRHSAEQAVSAVHQAQDCGFQNISIDLIFGLPVVQDAVTADTSANDTGEPAFALFCTDLERALSLGVQHLSAYSLMYEDGTPLTRLRDNGQVHEVDDDTSLRMFQHLMERMRQAGYEHYEISNYARPGFRSRHNSSYWDGTPYIGIGAGAHSFDGIDRSYHAADLNDYLHNPSARIHERLTQTQRYNEYMMTRLRTCEGLHLPTLLSRFGEQQHHYCLEAAQPHLQSGLLTLSSDHCLRLTPEGIFVSDDIMSDLIML